MNILEHLAIPMERIQAYSWKHFIIVFGIVLCAGILASILHKSKWNKKYILFGVGIFMLLIEVLKQILLTYVRGNSYSWSDFPWQLCSTHMYLCLIYPFVKKHSRTIELFIMSYGLLGAIFAFSIPCSNFTSYLLLTIHGLLWHGILLFLSFYLFLETEEPYSYKEFRNPAVLYIICAAIAVTFNVASYHISQGTSNMFFFGPGNPDVSILTAVQERCGWVVETMGMALCTLIGGFTIFNGYRGLYAARQHFRQSERKFIAKLPN